MAYDEYFAERIRGVLRERGRLWSEKKMMGGLCFLVEDKMCVGIVKNELMVRFDPDIQAEVLARPGCREMDFTKTVMKGYAFVSAEGVDREEDLAGFIDLALEFNPRAKSSKKRGT